MKIKRKKEKFGEIKTEEISAETETHSKLRNGKMAMWNGKSVIEMDFDFDSNRMFIKLNSKPINSGKITYAI